MEQVYTDTLGNTITLTYDSANDIVKVKNSGVDVDFRELKRDPMHQDTIILALEAEDNDNWDSYSDADTREKMRDYWSQNKQDQS